MALEISSLALLRELLRVAILKRVRRGYDSNTDRQLLNEVPD